MGKKDGFIGRIIRGISEKRKERIEEIARQIDEQEKARQAVRKYGFQTPHPQDSFFFSG